MSADAIKWSEIASNVAYLTLDWGHVAAVARRHALTSPKDPPVARLITWAFALLALGATGHMGFRVVAYAPGDMGSKIVTGRNSQELGLPGLGALGTVFTLTLFYVLILFVWRVRFDRPFGWIGTGLVRRRNVPGPDGAAGQCVERHRAAPEILNDPQPAPDDLRSERRLHNAWRRARARTQDRLACRLSDTLHARLLHVHLHHLAGDGEDDPLTDIGDPIRRSLQIMRCPEQIVRLVDPAAVLHDQL